MIVYPAEVFNNANFDEMSFDRHVSIHTEKRVQQKENTFQTSLDMKLFDRQEFTLLFKI